MVTQGARSGAEALAQLQSDQLCLDIALLDMHMPGMDGIELAKTIRRQELWRNLPMILLTSIGATAMGAAANDILHAYVEVGHELFVTALTKPCKAHQLADALNHAIGNGNRAATSAPKTHRPQQTAPQTRESRALRILLAEDNVINQKVALLILRNLGYDADVAADGKEALDALQRQPYDLVLMDIQMPEMDGLEATRQIRRTLAPSQQPRIVAMTANAMHGDRAVCLAAGMDDYISKPMRSGDLLAILSSIPTR
jgi:CheY-like chemotaxis protein